LTPVLRARRETLVGVVLVLAGLLVSYAAAFVLSPEGGGTEALAAGWLVVLGFTAVLVGAFLFVLAPRF